MKKILIISIAVCIIQGLSAIPNYWDPRNIISSADHDVFWSFGLSETGLQKLQPYRRFRISLLEQIDTHAADFIKHAREMIKNDPQAAQSYEQAIQIIEQAQKKGHDILDPQTLTKKELQTLQEITSSPTPEDVLQLSKKAKDQLAKLHVMIEGGSRFNERVPVIIATEEQHATLSSLLQDCAKRHRLSKADRVLIARAQASLDFARHFTTTSAGCYAKSDQGFFDKLKQNPSLLFILYPDEPEKECVAYLKARYALLNSTIEITRLPDQNKRVLPKELVDAEYKKLYAAATRTTTP